MSNRSQHKSEVDFFFEMLMNEYSNASIEKQPCHEYDKKNSSTPIIDLESEKSIVAKFVTNGCGCKSNCHKLFTIDEFLESRIRFRLYSSNEKNCYILGQLHSFSKRSRQSKNARGKTPRINQTFEYKINVDRPVCRETFLFYHGETKKRLKRLQKHFCDNGCRMLVHGNKGRKPPSSYDLSDQDSVVKFIINIAESNGLPDPGKDVRKGKGRLRILLPSIMNYTSIHQLYVDNISASGQVPVGYDTFVKIWRDELPYVSFNNPKTDLCFVCENYKKQLNKVAAFLDEEKEKEQKKIYESALLHLQHVQKERMYYRACAEAAQKSYEKLKTLNDHLSSAKANSRDIVMHYSWDFSQQLQYPFEEQQVGPIYFKTPRRAQMFGVCCEGIPLQVNYLIDEADFIEKNANTVISLLDHFFNNHGLGEKIAYLTADNCVGQNKNNALIQYLMYRVLMGLHQEISLSFLVVGHTKFSPDAYFGLIKKYYRRSNVYTYEQLVNIIEESSKNGHNKCQIYRNPVTKKPEIIYRDWSTWLSKYFKQLPRITSFHHFKINAAGELIVKEALDSKEIKFELLKKEFRSNDSSIFLDFPDIISPAGMTAERAWYLYDQLRIHIPNDDDKDKTCPKPESQKPKKVIETKNF